MEKGSTVLVHSDHVSGCHDVYSVPDDPNESLYPPTPLAFFSFIFFLMIMTVYLRVRYLEKSIKKIKKYLNTP